MDTNVMNVILSIKPKYADAILDKKKKCEFRKIKFPKNVDRVILYSSNGVGKMVGWFTIERQDVGKPDDIWKRHSRTGGITKQEFDDYYSGHEQAVCIIIKKVTRLDPPMDPFAIVRDFVPPQSYRYIKGMDLHPLNERIDNMRSKPLEHYCRHGTSI